MEPKIRDFFNLHFNEVAYKSLIDFFPKKYSCSVPFRIAETPIFLDVKFKNELIRAGEEILSQILNPATLEYSMKGIPPDCFVPGDMGNPNLLAIDFAIAADEQGNPAPRLIEFQGFPSLYAFQSEIGRVYLDLFPVPQPYTPFFNGLNEENYLSRLGEVILGSYAPEEVVLLEIEPWKQSTVIDFAITRKRFNIPILNLEDLILENKCLYYYDNGQKKKIKRIYNRVIFDELKKRTDLKLNFHLTEEVMVEWVVHPNWFFRISKFLMPMMDSVFAPKSYYLKDLTEFPKDLENYVLKPLYSFSGSGVIFNLQLEDLNKIKDKENFILQKKVIYMPVINTPDGGVKSEIRLLYIWDQTAKRPKLVTNLVRLSKGDMIGVKFNKEKTWVGSSIALFTE